METLKAIGRKWNSISLIKRILVGLIIGAILGVVWPGNDVLEMFGTLFVSALKGVAPILVSVSYTHLTLPTTSRGYL